MNLPGFTAARSLGRMMSRFPATTHERNSDGQSLLPSFYLPRVPGSWQTELNPGCYENCVFNQCRGSQNPQACQANCIKQCQTSFWSLPSLA
jgi:hypothetical protein